MTKKNSVKSIAILAGIAVIVFGVVYGGISLTKNIGKSETTISTENATETLNKIYKDINVNIVTPRKESVNIGSDDIKNSLPDIEKYPAQVNNTTPDFVEIFSSTEKAGEKTDGWLCDAANSFNKAGITVDGKPISVKIRGIASGTGVDYIVSGKYAPDAFSPSNELWGEMLKAKGISTKLTTKRLVGNVAGILTSKSKTKELVNKYGSINLKTICEAVTANEMAMGYTNPFASSTGLNFLVSTLNTFDSANPLSEQAVSAFEKFQTNIPYVAYTTLQMRESAKSGMLDGFIMEYQTFFNSPDLKSDYDFTPFGMRHDSPMYEIGDLSDTKKQILTKFSEFCNTEDIQKIATKYGFNNLDNYTSETADLTGDVIAQAQKLWKEKKNGTNNITAVFVADVSGSMNGEPINKLRESLLNGAKYIGKENKVGLVSFSNDVNINLPIAKFDINQMSLFTGAVTDLQAQGNTAMFDAIAVASKMLMDEKANDPNTKLMLFVLTDGETNKGHSLNDIQGILKTFKIPVYTIGYNANISVLKNISSLNEAANINADTDDVVYQLENLFNAQM